MTRAFMPGRWSRDGRAVPLSGCTGNFNQGCTACDCDTELSNATPLREEFPTPERTREDDAYRARALRRVLGAALVAYGSFAFLLWIASH